MSMKESALSNTTYQTSQTLVLENHPADSRVKICKDGIVQTLSSRMGTGAETYRWSWSHNVSETVNLLKPGYKTRLER